MCKGQVRKTVEEHFYSHLETEGRTVYNDSIRVKSAFYFCDGKVMPERPMKRNPKSRRGWRGAGKAANKLSFPSFLFLLSLTVFLLLGKFPLFSQETQTPEQRIKDTLLTLSKGYENKDIDLTMSAYSNAYTGAHQETLTDVRKRIQMILSAFQNIKFNFTKIDITVDEDTAVVLCDYRIIANAGAKKIYQRFKVKFSFILENDNWKIIREEVLALPGFTPGM